MPNFNLHYFARHITETIDKPFFVTIGAMDGKTFDPIHEFITSYKWHGLLVEPLPDMFAKLIKNYGAQTGLLFDNVAITEREETRRIHRINPDIVYTDKIPKWGKGASSFFPDRNALAWDDIVPHVVKEKVKCISLSALLEKHGVSKIDILQIDTEGYDYNILKQLDFETFRPTVINLEYVNLPANEQHACKQLLDKHNYIYIKAGYDLLAAALPLQAS